MEISWVNLIQNVGFPIAVALYFMFRMEKVLKNQTQVIEELLILLKTNGGIKWNKK